MSDGRLEIRFKDIPDVVAYQRNTKNISYNICNYIGTTIATLEDGFLQFKNSMKFARYSSLPKAMKRVSKVLRETEIKREFKDVPGIFASRNTRCLEAYDIYKYKHQGVSHTADLVGYLYSNGELSIYKKLVNDRQPLGLHQAIRLTYILTQKPSESFQWPMEHEFEDGN